MEPLGVGSEQAVASAWKQGIHLCAVDEWAKRQRRGLSARKERAGRLTGFVGDRLARALARLDARAVGRQKVALVTATVAKLSEELVRRESAREGDAPGQGGRRAPAAQRSWWTGRARSRRCGLAGTRQLLPPSEAWTRGTHLRSGSVEEGRRSALRIRRRRALRARRQTG